MAEANTSPAALRALAEHLSDEGEYLDATGYHIGAMLCRKAAATLTALAAEKEAGAPADWPTSASETARRILAILGKSDHPSLEPGADGRRDRIAALVERYAQSIVAERKVRVPAPAQGPLTEVGETSRGHKLYRAPNPAGGNTYWSDEIGGGVIVWDTCLVGEETLRLALSVETGAPAPDADGWIPWEGGRCPVPDGAHVRARTRDGSHLHWVASELEWAHRGHDTDVVAYCVSKEG